MPAQLDVNKEIGLGECIDRLLAGKEWSDRLPADEAGRHEVESLMGVAATVLRVAMSTVHIAEAQSQRLWYRIGAAIAPKQSRLRTIALYRLPYLPPLWIRPEAC